MGIFWQFNEPISSHIKVNNERILMRLMFSSGRGKWFVCLVCAIRIAHKHIIEMLVSKVCLSLCEYITKFTFHGQTKWAFNFLFFTYFDESKDSLNTVLFNIIQEIYIN